MPQFEIMVIGTINKDTTIFPGGKKTEGYGGILYNLSALSALGGSGTKIHPVCNVGYDVYDRIMEILQKYDNVKPDGIRKVRRKNNHARLFIDRENQREEILQHRVPVLSFSRLRPFLDVDAILVNFISGFDVSLDTLKKIRQHTDALVFMDIHSLTLGIHKDGRRFYRTPRSWKEYVRQSDLVQANLLELNALSGKNLKNIRELRDFAKQVLSLGPQVLLVTMGYKGALMIHKEGKRIKLEKSAGRKISGFKDATGCGDVFSAGYIACYLKTKNLKRSLDFANRVAAEKCRVIGAEDVVKLLAGYAKTVN
jgi:sugar/nucleoside kinase (ribokinase family)